MFLPKAAKITFAFLGIFILFFVCSLVLAEGLVPCTGPDCGISHIWTTIMNVVNFLLTYVVPSLAVILIVWGGITFITAQGDPGKVTKGKQILLAVAIGILIIYGARLIVTSFMGAIGANTEWLESITGK